MCKNGQGGMWKSFCCIALIALLAILGLGLDTLLVAKGENDFGVKAKPVYFRWEKMKVTVKYPVSGTNSTQSIKYTDAYDKYCKGKNSIDGNDGKLSRFYQYY